MAKLVNYIMVTKVLLLKIIDKNKEESYLTSWKQNLPSNTIFLVKFLTDLSYFIILRYLLSTLFSRVVLPTQAEVVKKDRTTNNAKS